jgi:uncharacterized protein YegP (UPF0339 family)
MYREGSSNLYRWTLYDDNNRMLAQSVEKYYNVKECLEAIERIKNSASVPVRQEPSSSSKVA